MTPFTAGRGPVGGVLPLAVNFEGAAMFEHRIALAVTVVLFLICLPQTAGSQPIIQGAGLEPCGKFADLYGTDPAAAESFYYSWAQGLLSGMNVALHVEGSTTDLTDSRYDTDAQQSYLRRYCNEHPSTPYFGAVMSLWDTMRTQQALPQWPPRQ